MAHLLHRFETLVPAMLPGLPEASEKSEEPWCGRWLEAIRTVGRQGDVHDLNPREWEGALFLARLCGWKPRGTFRRHEPDERFDDYWSGEDLWADEEDAAALAAALERALGRDDLPPLVNHPPDERQLRTEMPPEEAWLIHQMLWALHMLAPENRPELDSIVRFCRRGAFQIGSGRRRKRGAMPTARRKLSA